MLAQVRRPEFVPVAYALRPPKPVDRRRTAPLSAGEAKRPNTSRQSLESAATADDIRKLRLSDGTMTPIGAVP